MGPRRSGSCRAGRCASKGHPTLPHIGWNQVERTREHDLFDGIVDGADFYFVHSYAGAPGERDADDVLAHTEHGRRFVSAVARGPLLGVQFHPERSGVDGLRLLVQLRLARAGRLMLRRRVIPCLDVADGRVVKGTRFVDLVDEGDPPELAERYATEGADELVFLDITAAPEGRGTLLDIVERTARRAFIPLTVGGGVRSVSEMRDVLRAGADKVSLNTAAVADPTLVARCAARFGRQAVVVAIDARRRATSEPAWEVVVQGGRRPTDLDAVGVGRTRRRSGRGRAARDVHRSRRHGFGVRHGPACGPSPTGCPCRSSRPVAPPGRPISWPRSVMAARTRCWPPRSSIGGSTPSPT